MSNSDCAWNKLNVYISCNVKISKYNLRQKAYKNEFVVRHLRAKLLIGTCHMNYYLFILNR